MCSHTLVIQRSARVDVHAKRLEASVELHQGLVVILYTEDVGVLERQKVDQPQAVRLQSRIDVFEKGQLVLEHEGIDARLRPVDALHEIDDEIFVVIGQVHLGDRAQRRDTAEVLLPFLVDEEALLFEMVRQPAQDVELRDAWRRLLSHGLRIEVRNAEHKRVDEIGNFLHFLIESWE